MKKHGFDVPQGCHPIVPVMLGDARLAQLTAEELMKEGVYVTGFSYPVVPRGKARIRTQISAAHSKENLKFVVEKFAETRERVNIKS
jgi:glycine C-acetyltransferase